MSGEKGSGPCGKFQANFFNQTKCQNCFKSRELHLLGERDLEQVKPVYAGWLCLAPEGTDFDNPMQRSRKWQRRFFVLYEDGSLSFALDELPSTLPQGTVSVTLCTDILDAESRTGQRNALCLATAQQDVFIRGDSRDIINGWSEQLAAFLPTDGRSEKKPKVEPGACQEPTSAKTSPTGSGFLSSHHDDQDRGQDGTLVWTVPGPRGAAPGIAGTTGPKDSSGSRNRSSSAERMLGRKAAGIEQGGVGRDSRKGRSQARSGSREKLQSSGDVIRLSAAPPQRRSKSLDRRTSDSIVTPDLLNFKKGWMVKLDEDNQWKKSWFVLNADSLRYYKDSVAEEASDLEGEIDLTRCFSVAEFHVQRNYGFQIHTQAGVFTLSAMTAGIRKNWIQALMKNVHPANGPDVASLPGHLASSRTPEVLPKPDVTPDSSSSAPRPCGVADRRQKGRYQTFDWVEFRPPPPDSPGSPERRRRREERRRRYEDMLGFSLGGGGGGGGGGVEPLRVEEEVEECWRLVEKLMCRPEKMLPLISETETPLCGCRRAVEELTEQLEESERHRLKLEARLGSRQQQLDRRPPSPPSPPQPPRIWLQDSDGNLQQLEETPLPSPAAGGGNVELCGAEPDASEQAEVQRLSREVELLNQRNQEMLNQLTEADREIERLKAELAGRYAEPRLLPEAEQLEKRQVEEDQEPPEARAEPPCPEATEAKVTELEARLRQSEEAEEIHRRRAAEAEAEVRRLSRELEEERGRSRPHEDVTEATEVTAPSDDQSPSPLSQLKQEERFWSLLLRKLTELKEPAPPTSSASFLLSAAMDALTCCRTLELQAGPQRQGPTASDASCQTEEVEDLKGDEQEDLMENEKEDLKGDKMGDLQEEHQEDLKEDLKGDENQQENLQEDLQDQVEHQEDLEENHQVEHQEDLEENHQVEHQEDLEVDHQVEHQEDLEEDHQVEHQEDLQENQQVEDQEGVQENHQVEDLEENHQVEHQEDLKENHQVEHQEDLKENHQVEDLEENHQVEDLEENHQVEDLEENHQVEHQEDLEENHQVEHQEDLKDLEEDLQEDGPDLSFVEIRLDLEEDAEPDARVLVWALTERLQELQEQLRRQQQESQEELLRVGKEHRDQTDQLKAMCERGFSSMEEAQLKAVEELQRRHQQELQRLLLERDRLLEEESAATATAIEAIKNAHRLELQREVQRNRTRSLTESGGDGGGGGASHLEDVYRQHSEELESYQRELEVLSQQFSLKCLENGHLVQAVDAERKALCQCQQENQDLRTRNQELSGHLAAEITRLCSLAKQDALPLSQGMDLYEMEITLRVKESEVQCLKQEVESLKDELQSALKDKRNATKKFKDMYTELSIVRAKAQRDADQLRENLRLAHRALGQSSP